MAKIEFSSSVKNNTIRGHQMRMPDVWLGSVPIILSIHVWSILRVLEEMPAWILRLSISELLGVVAYTQVFALLESAFVLVFFLVVSFLLPKRWLAYQFVPATSILVFVATLWAIAAHNYDKVIRNWGAREFLPWLILVMISLALAWVLVSRSKKVRNAIVELVDRATVLAAVNLFIDSLSLVIILIRNM